MQLIKKKIKNEEYQFIGYSTYSDTTYYGFYIKDDDIFCRDFSAEFLEDVPHLLSYNVTTHFIFERQDDSGNKSDKEGHAIFHHVKQTIYFDVELGNFYTIYNKDIKTLTNLIENLNYIDGL